MIVHSNNSARTLIISRERGDSIFFIFLILINILSRWKFSPYLLCHGTHIFVGWILWDPVVTFQILVLWMGPTQLYVMVGEWKSQSTFKKKKEKKSIIELLYMYSHTCIDILIIFKLCDADIGAWHVSRHNCRGWNDTRDFRRTKETCHNW